MSEQKGRPAPWPHRADKDVGDILETALEKIESLLKDDHGLSKRAIGLLLLQEDGEIMHLVKSSQPEAWVAIEEIIKETSGRYSDPLSYIITLRRQEEASRMVNDAVEHLPQTKLSFKERLSRIMINPLTG